jgi:hypothetical protein
MEVLDEDFRFVLSVAAHKGRLRGDAIGIDSTTIQANASMRAIGHKDSGKGCTDDRKKLARTAFSTMRPTTSYGSWTEIARKNSLRPR